MFIGGYKVALPGSLVTIVCFFLPWIVVSCNGQIVDEFSGYELAAGPVINTVVGAQQGDPAPLLWLLPAAALLAVVLGLAAGGRGAVGVLDKVVTFLCGLLPLGYLVATILTAPNVPEVVEARQIGVTLDMRSGLWGTLAGFALITLGGVMNWFGANASSRQASSGQAGVTRQQG